MRVKQFYNVNQFVIFGDDGSTVFQSYSSVIAILKDGKLTLGKYWDYSKTTSKHLYNFLNEYYCTDEIYEALNNSNKKQAIQKLIDNGYITYNKYLE